MKFFSDDYCTVIAKDMEEAVEFFIEEGLTDKEGAQEIRKINPDKKKICFPLENLPRFVAAYIMVSRSL